jgi:hypothetical protein
MRYVADKIIAAGDLSGNLTSDPIDVRLQYGFSVFAIWSGTAPSGTLKIQASPDGINNWADVGVSTSVSGATGSWFTNQQWQFYPYVRFVYTRVSGTGSMDLWFTGKGG